MRKRCDLKKKLRVTFVGEAGLDMGGLTKEWFLLLVRQIFHTDYGETHFHLTGVRPSLPPFTLACGCSFSTLIPASASV